ncbi:MAG: L,D-transpeptidase [Pseudomonadota bacterium]
MIGRRTFFLGGAAALLGGCTVTETTQPQVSAKPQIPELYQVMYGPRPNERFPIPAVDLRQVDPRYWRREVPDPTGERPGTVVVDTGTFYLYWTLEGGRAMRYGVGLGRDGFGWDGAARIPFKREWPTWTPPAEMIAREPELEKYRDGMEPGLDNPLGARALYLFEGKVDTLYRLHGTQEAYSIGRAVSSGCVRLLNQDIIDLYNRVPNGTRVIVRPPSAASLV